MIPTANLHTPNHRRGATGCKPILSLSTSPGHHAHGPSTWSPEPNHTPLTTPTPCQPILALTTSPCCTITLMAPTKPTDTPDHRRPASLSTSPAATTLSWRPTQEHLSPLTLTRTRIALHMNRAPIGLSVFAQTASRSDGSPEQRANAKQAHPSDPAPLHLHRHRGAATAAAALALASETAGRVRKARPLLRAHRAQGP